VWVRDCANVYECMEGEGLLYVPVRKSELLHVCV